MALLVYLLIPVLLSSQVDDVWAVVCNFPTPPLVEEEVFIPSVRASKEAGSHADQKPVLPSLGSHTASFRIAQTGYQPERKSTSPLAPPPLYVFMSLQI
jgi:hypothetical protein